MTVAWFARGLVSQGLHGFFLLKVGQGNFVGCRRFNVCLIHSSFGGLAKLIFCVIFYI